MYPIETSLKKLPRRGVWLSLAPVLVLALACSEETTNNGPTDDDHDHSAVSVTNITVPDKYEFGSRFVTGESSVSYGGQTLRHMLIADLKKTIDGLTARVDNGDFASATAGDIVAELLFYYEFDAEANADAEHMISTDPTAKQSKYSEVGAANLKDKIAGNDPEGQHKDWTAGFIGWEQDGVVTPEDAVLAWFEELENLVLDRAANGPATDPSGADIAKAFVSPAGIDYKNLIQKFLDGAIVYSQGTDDYLDDDTEGKGLLTQNLTPDKEGSPYTTLEHQWDEGFGYFGAARDYGDYSDAQIAAEEQIDTDGDGAIDLKSERVFGHSINAAKRDEGSDAGAKTDFTQGAWDAFLTGRALIAAIHGPLTATQATELRALADAARANWEMAIAASAVHYVNDTLGDMAKLEANDDSYDFSEHAAHWSELKGFALALQFSPVKKISDAQLTELHDLIGQAPAIVSGTTEFDDYKEALLDARDILKSAYGFADANVEAW